jgi:hypothetical protein
MKDLQPGDKVMAANQKYQTVYSFGHVNEDAEDLFYQIHTREGLDISSSEVPLEMTGNHLIFKVGGEAVRADKIQAGDKLSSGQTVTKVSTTKKQGLYMPLTVDGTIVVNGILASSYVSIMEEAPRTVHAALGYIKNEQNLLHWWLAPYRMMCMGVSSKICSVSTNTEG